MESGRHSRQNGRYEAVRPEPCCDLAGSVLVGDKGDPALYGYVILNETMFTSYDRYTLQLFRAWLEAKYSTIERLNDVWDRAYRDWNQIEFTYWLWASVMPFVDWQQFRKANMG